MAIYHPGPPERLEEIARYSQEEHGDGFERAAEDFAREESGKRPGVIVELDEVVSENDLACRAQFKDGDFVS